jgi:hypothetical protein
MAAAFLDRPGKPRPFQPTHVALAQKDALDITLAEH